MQNVKTTYDELHELGEVFDALAKNAKGQFPLQSFIAVVGFKLATGLLRRRKNSYGALDESAYQRLKKNIPAVPQPEDCAILSKALNERNTNFLLILCTSGLNTTRRHMPVLADPTRVHELAKKYHYRALMWLIPHARG